MLVFIDHNNLCWFMDTKSLNSKQIRLAQKLSYYHFQIDYCQGKANGATNVLFYYPQRNAEEEKILYANNVKIFYHLQSSLAKVFRLLTTHFSPFYKILICETTILSQLNQF